MTFLPFPTRHVEFPVFSFADRTMENPIELFVSIAKDFLRERATLCVSKGLFEDRNKKMALCSGAALQVWMMMTIEQLRDLACDSRLSDMDIVRLLSYKTLFA